MDNNPRVFKLVVQEIDVRLVNGDDELFEDLIEIEYIGKVLPSTRKRIALAIKLAGVDGVGYPIVQTERRLA